MIYYPNLIDILEYEQREGLRQSEIRDILKKGMEVFIHEKNNKEEEDLTPLKSDKLHFLIGTAVHTRILWKKDFFNEKYFVTNQQSFPGEKTKAVLDNLFSKYKDTLIIPDIVDLKEEIWHCCNELGFNMKNKKDDYNSDTRVLGILKDNICVGYWRNLVLSKNKKIITSDMSDIIETINTSFMNNPLIKDLALASANNEVDLIFEKPMYFEIEGVKCKMLPDIIVIDHRKKVVYIIDIKTTSGPVSEFYKDFIYLYYSVQGSYYSDNLSFNKISEIIGKDLSGYTISNPVFIADSTTTPGFSISYVIGEDILEEGRDKYMKILREYKNWKLNNFKREKVLCPLVILDKEFYQENKF